MSPCVPSRKRVARRASHTRSALLVALLVAYGCTIPLADFAPVPQNACDSELDCGPGAACVDVAGARACVSTTADLEGLILEIRPAADGQLGAEASYLVDLAEHDVAIPYEDLRGQVIYFDPPVPAPAQVEGSLTLSGGSYCGGTSGAEFPVKVEFRRVPPYLGLPEQPRYTTTTVPGETDGQRSQNFQIELPIGDYDIYLAPQPMSVCTEIPPPILLPKTRVTERRTLPISAGTPDVIEGRIQVPQNVSVSGWKIDVVDSLSGNVISQVKTLEQLDLQLFATFNLEFYWTDRSAFSPVLRLRPPDGDARPTVYWDVTAVAPQGSTQNLTLVLSKLDAVPREVQGQALAVDRLPVPSAIRIQSASISGDVTTAVYRLDTETDEDGVFQVDLPPGDYEVFARPLNDTTKARAERSLTFPADDDCYCGQSIIIPDAGTVRGSVAGPRGESMEGAEVVAVPSITGDSTYLGRVLGSDPLLPRQVFTVLSGGQFSFSTDPGAFDFSVRPPMGAIYPWLVFSSLAVPAMDPPPVTDLGALTMRYPVLLQGAVRDASGTPLPAAMVRAWLPVRDLSSGGKLVGVIQIGEARSDADGSYLLPLPPSLSSQ
jgi:hypothetical protein